MNQNDHNEKIVQLYEKKPVVVDKVKYYVSIATFLLSFIILCYAYTAEYGNVVRVLLFGISVFLAINGIIRFRKSAPPTHVKTYNVETSHKSTSLTRSEK